DHDLHHTPTIGVNSAIARVEHEIRKKGCRLALSVIEIIQPYAIGVSAILFPVGEEVIVHVNPEQRTLARSALRNGILYRHDNRKDEQQSNHREDATGVSRLYGWVCHVCNHSEFETLSVNAALSPQHHPRLQTISLFLQYTQRNIIRR